jgi:hypothetical protein
MDGYVIARLRQGEAEEIFAKPQVRHVAELADGNTFIAFDGELPYEGGTVFEFELDAGIPLVPKIRSKIVDASTEYLGLYTAARFAAAPLMPGSDQVSLVGLDLVMVLSPTPLQGDLVWASKSERIWDKRLEVAPA